MANTPDIRFNGFIQPWEQRKISELANLRRGLTYSPTSIQDAGKRVLRSSNIAEDQFLLREDDVFIDEKAINIPYVKNGDIIITAANGSAKLVGKHAIIHGIEEKSTVHGGFMLLAEAHQPEFFNALLGSSWYNRFINIYVSGGNGAIGNLNKNDLNEQIVYVPQKAEQAMIGELFHFLDQYITLHQRQCDEMAELKKYMLQKMFPKKGEKFPEIRFSGFTEPWEERKLGDVFEEYSEKHHEELPVLTIIQGSGTILREESDRNLQYDKSSMSGYKMVKKDDFIVHLRSFEGGLEKANTDGIISPAYHTFHGENTDSRFFYPFFRSRRFIDVLLKPHVYGIRDGKSIDIGGMKTIMIPAPSYDEQKKIGEYIDALDSLIILHRRKHDELKELKKYMLQNMFPKKG